MGTPEFAVESLRVIVEAGYDVAAVVTAPDKPSGRGQKLKFSPVKEFAIKHQIKVLQPFRLKDPDFFMELKNYNANLHVVVAFRMLPEIIWQMPEFGSVNLHASLLPQYRGAAPINHAIINGETETGITTFFIEKEIDTGNIILSEKHLIMPSDNAGILHDRLMIAGGTLMLETLKMIENGSVRTQCQSNSSYGQTTIKSAPKIFKNYCRIDWYSSCISIHNLVRGLSPFPGAFSNIIASDGITKQIKIYKTACQYEKPEGLPGTIITDNKKSISVITSDGLLEILELQVEGKRRMKTTELLKGMTFQSGLHFV